MDAAQTLMMDAQASPGTEGLVAPNLDKANYLGNKRRLAAYIVDKFPKEARTAYDPMTGCSAVLMEAARRGYRVKGNDLSIVPYWYSKGIFEGVALEDSDIARLTDAPLQDGWLTREWQGIYPRPREIRRYLDGLARRAREWQGSKGWAAKAVASRVLQTLYSESGSGYSTRKYESLSKVKDVVRRAAREINRHVAEVSGKGTVTNLDAKNLRVPSTDVVYFDPPFFRKDKGAVHYFQSYRVMNSVLLGKGWKQANLGPDDIPAILKRLCKSCRHIVISTSADEAVPYAREIARHKRAMKRFRVSYRQTSGFGSRDVHQRQHLYVAKGEEFTKRRQVPFNQWGGSSKYAKKLAERLPAHKRYIEPFSGSAALFFAKESAAESILCDADSEVVFALRYIQSLTPERLQSLKRFPWTASRQGFKRARECRPRSDGERFWRLVYGRFCTWGGKPQMSGYSTIHDGQTYKFDELFRFKEKLKGTRLAVRDWKETLKACDSKDSLFFIDPPYVEEWGDKSGIPPEEIADAVKKLRGAFVIAYTDSARARAALSRVGKLFTMKFLEARNRGLWAKRSRLFAASFNIRKTVEIDAGGRPAGRELACSR